jgi:hypothetical protein
MINLAYHFARENMTLIKLDHPYDAHAFTHFPNPGTNQEQSMALDFSDAE